MKTQREYRRVTVGRTLDAKQLRAALSQTMLEMAKDLAPEAAPARLESVLIQPTLTTVYLSGNAPGLMAVATALRRSFSGVEISKALRADAVRPPPGPASRPRGGRKPGK